jgi:thymidylate synthase
MMKYFNLFMVFVRSLVQKRKERLSEYQYLDLMQDILSNGQRYGDRTKVGRVSVFARELRFDLNHGFPLLTTKKVFTRGIIEELVWFLSGSTDARVLVNKDVHIWDEWMVKPSDIANPSEKIQRLLGDDKDMSIDYQIGKDMLAVHEGTIGPLYGRMMRYAPGGDSAIHEALYGKDYLKQMEKELASDKMAKILETCEKGSQKYYDKIEAASCSVDQMQQLILNLKSNPRSSRHVVSLWMPEYLPDERLTPEENVLCGRQALPPCHVMQQYYVSNPKEEGGKLRLSLKLTQRSSDVFLGVPFNIASYSLLLMMVAQCVDMEPYEFIWSSGDTHLYSNQIEQAKLQLTREPRAFPTMILNPAKKDLFSFTIDDFKLEGYNPHPAIKAQVAK